MCQEHFLQRCVQRGEGTECQEYSDGKGESESDQDALAHQNGIPKPCKRSRSIMRSPSD